VPAGVLQCVAVCCGVVMYLASDVFGGNRAAGALQCVLQCVVIYLAGTVPAAWCLVCGAVYCCSVSCLSYPDVFGGSYARSVL